MTTPGTLSAEKMYTEIGRLYMQVALLQEVIQATRPPAGQPTPAELDKLEELSKVLKDSGLEPAPSQQPETSDGA